MTGHGISLAPLIDFVFPLLLPLSGLVLSTLPNLSFIPIFTSSKISTFTTVYSMRPLPSGAVFRCYPGIWIVFYDDQERPNRYLLAKEFISRPDAEDLEMIFGSAEQKSEQGQSLLDKAAGFFSSINRFMKAIS